MPRYFQSHVIGRPLVVNTAEGDRSFIFEPVEPMGGSWLGVLAVDDESAANTLATTTAAWEITEQKFDELKKKRASAATPQGFVPSRTPQLPPQPLEAPANPAVRRSDSVSEAPVGAAPKPVTNVTLLTTDKKPPHEPLLELGTPKRRKAA
jgi:hypothetical protein